MWRLHVTIFTPYEAWAAHENFEPFHRLMESRAMFTEDPAAILTGLLDLCTFFCLWSEASTLRHMPESLWFFFWCATSAECLCLARHVRVFGVVLLQVCADRSFWPLSFTALRFIHYVVSDIYLQYVPKQPESSYMLCSACVANHIEQSGAWYFSAKPTR